MFSTEEIRIGIELIMIIVAFSVGRYTHDIKKAEILKLGVVFSVLAFLVAFGSAVHSQSLEARMSTIEGVFAEAR